MSKLADFMKKELSRGIPAAEVVDRVFSKGLLKPDTQRTRERAEEMLMALKGSEIQRAFEMTLLNRIGGFYRTLELADMGHDDIKGAFTAAWRYLKHETKASDEVLANFFISQEGRFLADRLAGHTADLGAFDMRLASERTDLLKAVKRIEKATLKGAFEAA